MVGFKKFLIKSIRWLMIWVITPCLAALIILSVGVNFAEEKGWLFEAEKVELIDVNKIADNKSKELTSLEDVINKDINNTFLEYLNYKKMPNILYAKDSVILMSYTDDYFTKKINDFESANNDRLQSFTQYESKLISNQKVATNNLKNSYLQFINDLKNLHEKENVLLQHINGTKVLSSKEQRNLKNDMISLHVDLSNQYTRIVEDYHLWTNKTAYLPYYDETTMVIEEMKKKEETLSVGISSPESLNKYTNIFNELKKIEMKETSLSLNYSVEEIKLPSMKSFINDYEIYLESLKSYQSELVKKEKEWSTTLFEDNSFMQKETNKVISLYNEYLTNKINHATQVNTYYKNDKIDTLLYYELLENEIIINDEKAKLNIIFENFNKLIEELKGGELEDVESIK